MDIESKKISSRELNRGQRRKLAHVVRWYKRENAYSGVTSIRFELRDYGSVISLVVRTWRSDCGHYSPRAIVCEQYLHAMIGPRGGLKIYTARSGLHSEKTRVRRWL